MGGFGDDVQCVSLNTSKLWTNSLLKPCQVI